MRYVNLGKSGLQVSRLCLGGNSWGSKGKRQWTGLDADDSRPFLHRALDAGINFFDTAPSYNDGGSEEVLGQCLVGAVPRDELVLLSKVGFPRPPGPNRSGLSRKHIFASVDASLARLRTDHVDLLVVHRFDPHTPIEETLTALAEVVQAGKALYLGASSMAVRDFIRMQLFLKAREMPPFIAMQNLYNLLYREDERELIPFCREEGIGLTPYSPLARGVLSGKRGADGAGATERAKGDAKKALEFYCDHTPAIIGATVQAAEARGVKPAQVALAWVLGRAGVSAPVVGATRPEHIDDAVAALDIELEPDEIEAMETPYQPRGLLS